MIYTLGLIVAMIMGAGVTELLCRRRCRQHCAKLEAKEAALKNQLEQHRRALAEITYQTHHDWINPRSKRVRGLCNLMRIVITKNLSNDEIVTYITMIETEALEMEMDVLNTVKKFEHLHDDTK